MSNTTRPPSAKPLFKAISGKGRAKSSPAIAMFSDLPDQAKPLPEHERRAEDFYPTGQPEAIRSLFGYDGPRIRDSWSVWEPACGDGALVREIRAMGMTCIASDLVDRGCPDSTIANFYSATRSPARAIITNPPFCEISSKGGGRWLRHTLAMPGWDYLALLLSWDWPAGRINGLGQLLDEQPCSWSYLMRWKLDFTGEGNPAQRNGWFVWDRRDPRGPTHPKLYGDFRMMDRIDPRQEVLI
ncbi:hypothetical protein F1642_05150 [Paracoccus sp. NBH48]|uniref:hypothetical protein n=1 Tax=Paracoccus sp. NBH48 TaxID=2596918 RepID=UPI0018915644|nr:hypothetical protein [Paracoccus sp. NBH48]MBF5078551.1 hypothetical protein [Paracoccus sp. NBH48]